MEQTYEVLSPVAESGADLGALAPRLDSVAGKTIGLLDNSKEYAKAFLDLLAVKLKERYPDLTTKRYTKRTPEWIEPHLIKQISEECRGVVNGIGGAEPIPYKKTEKYPSLGTPDSSDDIRGGMELKGVLHLKTFIERGGLFVPITGNADLPIAYGIVESVAVAEPKKLKAAGSVLSANVTDTLSPIGYGYDRNLGVYFNSGPVLETGMKAVIGADIGDLLSGGATAGRPSGRGGLKDPDVIQGRPQKVEKFAGGGGGIPAEYKDLFDLYMPADLKTVRVIVRFDTADKLLISGMLEGGEELAGKPAVVDVPVGKGHVVFFAVNPMWRQQTFGSFGLLFNAAMNYRSLDVGRAAPAPEAK